MGTITLLFLTLAANIIYYKYSNIQSVVCSLIPLSMALYTYFGCVIFNFAFVIPFSLFDSHNDQSVIFAVNYFAFFSLSLVLGAVLSQKFIKTGYNIQKNDHKLLITDLLLNNTKTILILLSLLPSIISAINYSFSDFLYRDFYYMDGRYEIISKLSQLIFPVGAAAAALGRSWVAKIGFMLGLIILFSLNSRGIILYVLTYSLVSIINQEKNKLWMPALSILSVLVFASTSFLLRDRIPQGLVGNIISLGDANFDEILNSMISGFNYLLSYPLATFLTTDIMASGDDDLFFASVIPLPSIIYNVEYIINTGKINEFSPFSAVGQIFAYLGFWSLIFWMIYGASVNYLINGFFKSTLFSSFMMGVFALVTILSTTYNLRGVARLIYITPVLAIVIKMIELKLYDYMSWRAKKIHKFNLEYTNL